MVAGRAAGQALKNSNVAEMLLFPSTERPVVFGNDCLDRFLGHRD